MSQTIPIGQVEPWPGNPRKTFGQLDELAASLKAQGVLQPLLVRAKPGQHKNKHVYQIADGERRYRAAKLAGLKELPILVRELSDQQMLEIAVVSTEQRAEVPAAEKAAGYQRLIDEFGLSVDQVAAKVGRSPTTIRALLRLSRMPAELAQAVAAGRVPQSTAELVCRVPGEFLRGRVATAVRLGIHCNSIEALGDPKHQLKRWDKEKDPEPLSFRETKLMIQRCCLVELKQAIFPVKRPDLAGAPPCPDCPKRAGNDPDCVAEGVRADVCTDPGCFAEKTKAWGDVLQEAARASGAKVLTAKESQGLFNSWNGHLSYDAPYVDFADQCPRDTKKTKRSYKQLLEGVVPRKDLVCAIDSRGRTHELVPYALAAKLLKSEHGIALAKPSSHGATPAGPKTEAQKKEEAKRREENRLQRAETRALLAAAAESAAKLFAPLAGSARAAQVLRVLAGEVVGNTWGSTIEDVAARRGLKGRTMDLREGLLAEVEQLEAPGLLALLVEFQAGRDLVHAEGKRDDRPEEKEFAAGLSIDVAAVRQAAREAAKNGNGKPSLPTAVNGVPRPADKPSANGSPQHEGLPLAVGDVVRTSYGTGPYRITAITGGKPTWSLTVRDANDPAARKDGWINDLQAGADGRILASNGDEVFRVPAGTPPGPSYWDWLREHKLHNAADDDTGELLQRAWMRGEPPPAHVKPSLAAAARSAAVGNPSGFADLIPDPWRRLEVEELDCTRQTAQHLRKKKICTLGDLADELDTGNTIGLSPGICAKLKEQLDALRQAKPAQAPLPSWKAGQCRVCGCTEANCQRCVERTGEPCSWTSPGKDLCTACLPIIEKEVSVLELEVDEAALHRRDVAQLEDAGLRCVGHVLALDLAALPKGIERRLAERAIAAAQAWVKMELAHDTEGNEMMPLPGDEDEDEDEDLEEEEKRKPRKRKAGAR